MSITPMVCPSVLATYSVEPSARIEIARVRSIEVGAAAGNLRNLGERGTRIDAERPDLIVEAIGRVESSARRVEDQILTVEVRLEGPDHGVGAGIDDAREIGVLVYDDGVRPRIDGSVHG
jgi:hypothetical protein